MISVVIPTHNRPETLRAAIQSVFTQNVLPRDLIVVDDGSEQPVLEAVFNGAPAGLRTRLIRNDRSVGSANSRNIGVRKSPGEWIAFLDDDDVFVPEKIKVLKKAIREYPSAGLIYHRALIRMVQENISYPSGAQDLNLFPDKTKRILIQNLIGGTSMVAVSKAVFERFGGFDPMMPPVEDWELWIRMVYGGVSIQFVNGLLTTYHHHTGMGSLTKSDEKRERAVALIMEKHRPLYEAQPAALLREFRAGRQKDRVFAALLNGKKWLAVKRQFKLFVHTFKVRDLLAAMVITAGIRVAFKMRAAKSLRNA